MARAEVYRSLNEHATAEEFYRRVLEDEPDNPRALLGLGRVLFDQNKMDEAMEALVAAADTARGRPEEEATGAEAFMTAAAAFLKLSPPRLERAQQMLAGYYELRPDGPSGCDWFHRGLYP